MRTKLENTAAIAEIVGAVAIVVTLIVLIHETRENTAATYSSTYDQLQRDLIQWEMTLASDPDLLSEYLVFNQSQTVEGPIEATPATLVSNAWFRIAERAYFAYRYGRLADEEWDRYYRQMCTSGYAARRRWPNTERGIFTNEFAQFLDDCETTAGDLVH